MVFLKPRRQYSRQFCLATDYSLCAARVWCKLPAFTVWCGVMEYLCGLLRACFVKEALQSAWWYSLSLPLVWSCAWTLMAFLNRARAIVPLGQHPWSWTRRLPLLTSFMS